MGASRATRPQRHGRGLWVEMTAASAELQAWAASPPHREPLEGETLSKCAECGKVEVSLTEEETWHYVRTGEGLVSKCPLRLRGIWNKCRWVPVAGVCGLR